MTFPTGQNNLVVKFIEDYMASLQGKSSSQIEMDFANANSPSYVRVKALADKNKSDGGDGFATSLALYIAIQADQFVKTSPSEAAKNFCTIVTNFYSAVKEQDQAAINMLDQLPKIALALLDDISVNTQTENVQNLIQSLFIFSKIIGVLVSTPTAVIFGREVPNIYQLGMISKGIKSQDVISALANVATACKTKFNESERTMNPMYIEPDVLDIVEVKNPTFSDDPDSMGMDPIKYYLSKNLNAISESQPDKVSVYLSTVGVALNNLKQLRTMYTYAINFNDFLSKLSSTSSNDLVVREEYDTMLNMISPEIAGAWRDPLLIQAKDKDGFLNILKSQLSVVTQGFLENLKTNSNLSGHDRHMVNGLTNSLEGLSVSQIDDIADKALILNDIYKIEALIITSPHRKLLLPNWLRPNFLFPTAALHAELRKCKNALKRMEKIEKLGSAELIKLSQMLENTTFKGSTKELLEQKRQLKAARRFFKSDASESGDKKTDSTNPPMKPRGR